MSVVNHPAVPLPVPLSQLKEFGVLCCPVLPLGEQLLLGAVVSCDAPSQHLALVMEACRTKQGAEAGPESSLWSQEAAALYGAFPSPGHRHCVARPCHLKA